MNASVRQLQLGSGMFRVNAYLVETADGCVLVDTGMRSHRAALESQLADAGCSAGKLRLILLTHGDFDHIGNAAYVARAFGAPIAMHPGDREMAKRGDMFAGRQQPGYIARALLPLLARLPDKERFEPDLLLDEGSDLTDYGLEGARILLLRGHSSGSIALLLADGSLLCGDVLENRSKPKLGSIMDDVPTAEASVARLRDMGVGTVYPGHGAPFDFGELPPTRNGAHT